MKKNSNFKIALILSTLYTIFALIYFFWSNKNGFEQIKFFEIIFYPNNLLNFLVLYSEKSPIPIILVSNILLIFIYATFIWLHLKIFRSK